MEWGVTGHPGQVWINSGSSVGKVWVRCWSSVSHTRPSSRPSMTGGRTTSICWTTGTSGEMPCFSFNRRAKAANGGSGRTCGADPAGQPRPASPRSPAGSGSNPTGPRCSLASQATCRPRQPRAGPRPGRHCRRQGGGHPRRPRHQRRTSLSGCRRTRRRSNGLQPRQPNPWRHLLGHPRHLLGHRRSSHRFRPSQRIWRTRRHRRLLQDSGIPDSSWTCRMEDSGRCGSHPMRRAKQRRR